MVLVVFDCFWVLLSSVLLSVFCALECSKVLRNFGVTVLMPCSECFHLLKMLSPDEYFNVLKIQNGVECSKEEVKTVCLPLPCSKDGKIKIRDFLYLDIHRFVAEIRG